MVQLKYSPRMAETYEELITVRKLGASIIDRPPVFSQDSSFLFVACGSSIRSYNVDNGQPVQDFEGLISTAAGVQLNPDNSDFVVAVSCKGQLVEWEWRVSSAPSRILNIKVPRKRRISSFFLVPSTKGDDYDVVAAAIDATVNSSDVMLFSGRTGKQKDFKGFRIQQDFHSLAARHHNRETLIAGICNKTLNYTILQDGRSVHRGTKERPVRTTFSCVTCHPSRPCVLVGCLNGYLYLWQNLLGNQPPILFQWHTLPVRDIMFNHTGTSFYSAGDETVVVKWLLEAPEKRTYIPRFPAEIVYLALSSTSLVSVSTRDNGIEITTPGTLKRTVIQHLSWTTGATQGCLLPAGLKYNPGTKSLVLNARVGYIQFVRLPDMKSFNMLDVTECNYFIQNRKTHGGVMKNTEVLKVEFNSTGHWMATVEHWGGEVDVQPELRLKFWEYMSTNEVFRLNTCIELPHRGSLNDLKFRPSAGSESEMCITCGEDKRFRTWVPMEREGFFTGVAWRAENVGFHRDEPAGPLDFSSDGSLVAIAFGPTLTIWVPKVNDLKCSLTQPVVEPAEIRHVYFGRESCSHFVVTGTKCGIAVWNILSLSLSLVVPFDLQTLIADPLSSVMAAFTTCNEVVVFSPNSPDMIHKQASLLPKGDKVIAAAFIPRSHSEMQHSSHDNSLTLRDRRSTEHPAKEVASWQSRSQLYFINTKEELLSLEPNVLSGEGRALDRIPERSFARKESTLFAALNARDVVSDVKDLQRVRHTKLGIPGFQTLREILASPAHTMPSPSLLCRSLLLSFISSGIPSAETQKIKNRLPRSSERVGSEDVDDDDEEEEEQEEQEEEDDDEEEDVEEEVAQVTKEDNDEEEEMEVDSGAEMLSDEKSPKKQKQIKRTKSRGKNISFENPVVL